MRSVRLIQPIHIWAMRDVLRRPGEALLLAASLCLIVILSGTALLLVQSLSHTARKMIELAPALVVRKVGPAGWEPIPEREALDSAASVPGVTEARSRVWGLVAGPQGALTVVGTAGGTDILTPVTGTVQLPMEGEAVVGEGVGPLEPGDMLELTGAETMAFRVTGRFPADTAAAAYDVVLLQKKDGMRLLGLPEGSASDLAVHLSSDEEQSAILPDLSGAFPWPVRITSRSETSGYYSSSFAKRGGLIVVTLIPSLMALALLIAYLVRERTGRRHEVGVLKSMGWTTGDLVKVQVWKSLLIALPAAVLGSLVSYVLVLRPGARWPAGLFFGWDGTPPALHLDAGGGFLVLMEIVCLVVVPFIVSALWPALSSASADPQDLIEEET